MQRGSELKIAAGEECLALTRVKLERLHISEQDGRSVGHGHQAAVEQRQAREAMGVARKAKCALLAHWYGLATPQR